jgi:hypothetical protein
MRIIFNWSYFSFSGVNDVTVTAPVCNSNSIFFLNIFFFFSCSKKYHFLVDTNVVSSNFLLIIKWYDNKFYVVTDRRTYKDRRDVWASEKKKAEYVAERPKAKIRHNTPPPEENPLRKTKGGAGNNTTNEGQNEEDLVSYNWRKIFLFELFFFLASSTWGWRSTSWRSTCWRRRRRRRINQ